MHRILAFLVLAGLLWAVGCAEPGSLGDMLSPSQVQMYEQMDVREMGGTSIIAPAAAAPQVEQSPTLSVIDPRKVIYSGLFTVVVDSAAASVKAAKSLAESLGGYMQHMTQTSITIRVPAEKFNQTIGKIEQMGQVSDKSIDAQDVTEQYVDLELRMRNARALLTKLEKLLAKAERIEDILAIEKELARVRTQIEQLEGKINAMSSRIAYSTITVRFIEIEHAPGELKVRLPFWWLRTLGAEKVLGLKSRADL